MPIISRAKVRHGCLATVEGLKATPGPSAHWRLKAPRSLEPVPSGPGTPTSISRGGTVNVISHSLVEAGACHWHLRQPCFTWRALLLHVDSYSSSSTSDTCRLERSSRSGLLDDTRASRSLSCARCGSSAMLCRVALFYPTGSSKAVGAARNCISIKFHLALRLSATPRIAPPSAAVLHLLSGIYCELPSHLGPPPPSPCLLVLVITTALPLRWRCFPHPIPAPPCPPMGAPGILRPISGRGRHLTQTWTRLFQVGG